MAAAEDFTMINAEFGLDELAIEAAPTHIW